MTAPKWFAVVAPPTTPLTSAALLILRLVSGWALHFHGMPKLHDPLHWLDNSPSLHAAVPWAPGFVEPIIAVAEGIGSIFIMLGLLTRFFAFFVVCDLAVAVIFVGMIPGHNFVGGRESFEVPALLWTAAATLLVAGPGQLSLDALLVRRLETSR